MDLGEAEILKTEYEGYAKWEEYLKDYFAERGMGDEWVKYGLWRWKRPPASVLKRLGEEGISIQIPKDAEAGSTSKLTPRKTENVLLAFDGDFDMERIAPFLNILSPLNEKEDGSLQLENTAAGLTLHPDGSIIAEDMEKPYKRDLRRLEELIYRAAECVGCGICPGRCPTGALDIEDWRIVIDVERCAHCSLCLDGPCPVVDFGHGM